MGGEDDQKKATSSADPKDCQSCLALSFLTRNDRGCKVAGSNITYPCRFALAKQRVAQRVARYLLVTRR